MTTERNTWKTALVLYEAIDGRAFPINRAGNLHVYHLGLSEDEAREEHARNYFDEMDRTGRLRRELAERYNDSHYQRGRTDMLKEICSMLVDHGEHHISAYVASVMPSTSVAKHKTQGE